MAVHLYQVIGHFKRSLSMKKKNPDNFVVDNNAHLFSHYL